MNNFLILICLCVAIQIPLAALAQPQISEQWASPSETSAVIFWQTDEPATSYVEYSTDTSYSMQSTLQGANWLNGEGYHTHFHILAGLQRNTQYHYRLVSTNDQGETTTSSDMTFSTQDYPSKVQVPGALSGPPYVLDQANTVYVLTQDMIIDQRAFEITASGVTFDLDGHKIIYNDAHSGMDNSDWSYLRDNSWLGVYVDGDSVTLKNGMIEQGAGNDDASEACIGFNPIYVAGSTNAEFSGLKIRYSGAQVCGIMFHWGGEGSRIHHNFFDDKGTVVLNRHEMTKAIMSPRGNNVRIDHNLINRTRQGGVIFNDGSNAEYDHNEIYIDSWDTNSYGIWMGGGSYDFNVHDNRIFATGYHSVGIGTTGGGEGHEIYRNNIKMYAREPEPRTTEYGALSSMNGFRMTWSRGVGIEYHDNNVEIHAQDGGTCRGTWFYQYSDVPMQLQFYDNNISTYSADANSECCGLKPVGNNDLNQYTVNYNNNRITSDSCNVGLGDDYGYAHNTLFDSNTFIREGSNSYYNTIQVGYGNAGFQNHVFRDTVLQNGASLRSVNWICGNGPCSFSAEWTLRVNVQDALGNPLDGARVIIENFQGATVYDETIPGSSVEVILPEFRMEGSHDATTTEYNPYTVTAEIFGNPFSETVTVDSTESITITADSSIPAVSNVQCELNSAGNWQACSSAGFGDQILRVRAECTQGSAAITRADFEMTHQRDTLTLFSGQESGSGPQFTYDNNDLEISSSDNYVLSVTCWDADGKYARLQTSIAIPYGTLSSQQVTPLGSGNVQDGSSIQYTTRVTCSGGECGDIIATLDPTVELGLDSADLLEDTYSRPQGSSSYGSAESLAAGYLYHREYRIWLKFDMSSIPDGAAINSANLRLYHNSDVGATDGELLAVYGSTSSGWTEDGCYDHETYPDTCPTIQAELASGVVMAGANRDEYWQDFPLNNLAWLESRIAAGTDEITFMINRSSSDTSIHKYSLYRSKEHTNPDLTPRIIIDYEPPGYKGGVVPTITGSPFYTDSHNPAGPQQVTCLESMTDGSTCDVSWRVFANATGGNFTFYALFDSQEYLGEVAGIESEHVQVIISDCTNQISRFDTNPCNGQIELGEVATAISMWYSDGVSISELIAALRIWKNGS